MMTFANLIPIILFGIVLGITVILLLGLSRWERYCCGDPDDDAGNAGSIQPRGR